MHHGEQDSSNSVKTNSSHLGRLIPRTRVAQAQNRAWNIVCCPKVFTSPCAMSYETSLISGTPSPGTCTPSLTVIRPPLLHFPLILFSARFNPAPIPVNLSVVHWRNPQPLQDFLRAFRAAEQLSPKGWKTRCRSDGGPKLVRSADTCQKLFLHSLVQSREA